jgi:hypothetical protein
MFRCIPVVLTGDRLSGLRALTMLERLSMPTTLSNDVSHYYSLPFPSIIIFSFTPAGLRDEIESVQREKERMNQMDADLTQANDTLTRLNRGITDLIPGLDSLAKEWANVRLHLAVAPFSSVISNSESYLVSP